MVEDYIRAPRPQCRSKLRQMGLYFQCHQEIPPKPCFCTTGSLRSNYDCALHGCICEASYQDLPQERSARHGEFPNLDERRMT